METRIDRIGLDLGSAAQAEALADAAAELGPDMVRLRFGLEGHVEPDSDYLADASQAVDALRERGLRVLAVIDSDLTVAPEGMGAFLDRPPGPLARAWTDEIVSNAGRLARAIGDRVAAWEVLPLPNAGSPARIAPARWAGLVTTVAEALRAAAPGARIVSGGLLSEDGDDGLDYLRAAWRAARAAGLWPEGRPPFDQLGLRLVMLPEGGDSEELLASALLERVRRVAETLRELLGESAEAPPGLVVTGLSWDVDRAGEDVQARNTWTALDALTAEPAVSMVVWTGLTDSNPHAEGATGLCRGARTDEGARRYAWRAFRDFATYARQISPSPLAEAMHDAAREAERAERAAEAAAPSEPARPEASEAEAATPRPTDAPGEGEPDAEGSPEPQEAGLARRLASAGLAGASAIAALAGRGGSEAPEAEDGEDAMAEVEAEAERGARAGEVPDHAGVEPAAPLAETGDVPAAEPAAEGAAEADEAPELPDLGEETIAIHIPNAEEVLRARGYEGERLAELLRAVQRRYGGYEWLPPGDYAVTVPRREAADAEPEIAADEAPEEGAATPEPALAEPIETALTEPEPSEAPAPGARRLPTLPEGTSEPAEPAGAELTNQQVISALYRAGGGTWDLFERSGLSLRELAAQRTRAYAGPALSSLEGLDEDEREALRREIERLA